jgi:hypothetical protein
LNLGADILLTPGGNRIYRGSVDSRAMSARKAINTRSSAATWQVLVCFLLAGLFLYNPFLMGQRENGGLAVCHPASHRATVGASELEKFSPLDQSLAPLPDLNVVRIFLDPTALAPSTAVPAADRDEVIPPQTVFYPSLWFRPPPAVS